jgi:hypothetical protein
VCICASASVFSQKRVALFNGKNLDGWYAFEPETGKHSNANDLFKVYHGMICLEGPKPGYIKTELEFREFELFAEFRWNPDTTLAQKSKKRNSGLMYLMPFQSADTLWPQGIQFQIKEGATGDFILLHELSIVVAGKETEKGRSVISPRFIEAEKQIGEWNAIYIRCADDSIVQKLNGILVNKASKPSVKSGRIGLMYEGSPIQFRKIKIREIRE